MALAAADITRIATFRFLGAKRVTFGYWTPSGTYTSGGEDLTIAISQSKLEMRNVQFMLFSPLFNAAVSAFGLAPVFDGTRTATSNGKLHILNAVAVHTHGLLVTGNQGAGTALQFTPDSNSGIVGQSANVANRTLAGGTSNILNSTAVTAASEVAAATDFSTGTYKCWFLAVGTG